MTRTRLRAGAAKVDITPDLAKIRIQLGGYNARLNMPPTGVHDPIYARALALEVGEQSAVLVALDHLLIPWSLTRNVLQAAGLQSPQLFISASHTHCAPDSMGLNERMRFPLPGVGTFLPEFLAFTTERVVQTIQQARQRMRPATLAITAAELPNLNRNRRGRRLLDRTMTVAATGRLARQAVRGGGGLRCTSDDLPPYDDAGLGGVSRRGADDARARVGARRNRAVS
jgi:hypothetical protein